MGLFSAALGAFGKKRKNKGGKVNASVMEGIFGARSSKKNPRQSSIQKIHAAAQAKKQARQDKAAKAVSVIGGILGNKSGTNAQQAKQAKIDKYIASGGAFSKALSKAQANTGSSWKGHIGGLIAAGSNQVRKGVDPIMGASLAGATGMSTSQPSQGGASLSVATAGPVGLVGTDPSVVSPQISAAAEQFEKPAGSSDFSKPASLVESFDPRSRGVATGIFGDSVSRQKSVEAYSKNWSHLT